MTTTTKTLHAAPPNIAPLATDPRVQQAQARVVALQQRLQAVGQELADGQRVDMTGDYVERLLADPGVILTPPPDRTKALEAEAKALPRAIAAAETDAKRIRDEVSLARSKAMRPDKVATARELATLLERTASLLKAEVQLCAHLNAAEYAWEGVLPPLAYPGDLDNVDRLVQRVRASGLLED